MRYRTPANSLTQFSLLGIKWKFQDPINLAPRFLGCCHTTLCSSNTRVHSYVSRLCHLRFPLPGNVSASLCVTSLFSYIYSTQKAISELSNPALPPSLLPAPRHPQQADPCRHTTTFYYLHGTHHYLNHLICEFPYCLH